MRLSTRVTPFLLMYGSEAVVLVEMELPTACPVIAAKLEPFHRNYAIEHIVTLEYLDKYRNDAGKRLQCY